MFAAPLDPVSPIVLDRYRRTPRLKRQLHQRLQREARLHRELERALGAAGEIPDVQRERDAVGRRPAALEVEFAVLPDPLVEEGILLPERGARFIAATPEEPRPLDAAVVLVLEPPQQFSDRRGRLRRQLDDLALGVRTFSRIESVPRDATTFRAARSSNPISCQSSLSISRAASMSTSFSLTMGMTSLSPCSASTDDSCLQPVVVVTRTTSTPSSSCTVEASLSSRRSSTSSSKSFASGRAAEFESQHRISASRSRAGVDFGRAGRSPSRTRSAIATSFLASANGSSPVSTSARRTATAKTSAEAPSRSSAPASPSSGAM